MKKRFSTFGISCLLLAAFIGSAEAKKIDTTNDAGAGLLQFATESDSRFLQGGKATEWAVAETDDSIKWLLALYRVDDASDFLAWNTSSNSTDKTLPTSEEFEMDFSLGGGTLFGYDLAGLVYGDPLENQTTAATAAKDQQPSTPPAAAGGDSIVQKPGSSVKIPVTSYGTIPVTYIDPPTRVYTEEPTRSKKKDPKPEKTPDFAPAKPPQVDTPPAGDAPPEVVIPAVSTEKPTRLKKKDPKPKKTPDSASAKQPSADNPPAGVASPEVVIPAVSTEEPTRSKQKDPKAEKPPQTVNPPADVIPPQVVITIDPPGLAGPYENSEFPGFIHSSPDPTKVELVDNSTVNSPAPVPEPATMLLFSTGIAGLAFSSRRRNKNTMTGKKGNSSPTGNA